MVTDGEDFDNGEQRVKNFAADKAEFLVPVGLAAVFAFTALLHHLQKEDLQTYVNSALIPLEFFLLLVSIAGLAGALLFILVYLFRRRWRKVLLGAISFIATYLFISFGLYIDASTLIYMT